MKLWQRLLILLGYQFVMIRCAHSLTFRIKRAYLIGGYWYSRARAGGYEPATEKHVEKGYKYWMLTNGNLIKDFKELEPGTMVSSTELWFPITKTVAAWVSVST